VDAARTAAFLTLVVVQLIHVFECKSETKNILHIRLLNNIPLILAVLLSFAMIIGVIYIPVLQPIFSTVALTGPEIFRVIMYSVLGPALSIILFHNRSDKRVKRKAAQN
jgi:Cation transport ATPase